MLALRQMSYMVAGAGPEATSRAEPLDPALVHGRQVDARRGAYAELLARAGWLRRPLLRRVHTLIELYAGTRETPKHELVRLVAALRRRALVEGRRLVEAGRLDAPEHVFDLTFHDLVAALRDGALDVRALRERRSAFQRRIAGRVRHFPQVIDSRGRILRPPPRHETPGVLRGMPIAAGVARGPVKLLHDPHDKPLAPGDILVAYTTDPGWTPLFVNAAAIVLEIGGVLQHGAVIAREYGKPCVAGIDRVMTRLRDGQRVEVDGTAGVIRLLDPEDASA
jgi:pyruvate,water dikinase